MKGVRGGDERERKKKRTVCHWLLKREEGGVEGRKEGEGRGRWREDVGEGRALVVRGEEREGRGEERGERGEGIR